MNSPFCRCLVLLAFSLAAPLLVHAGSATWTGSDSSGWSDVNNWAPQTVPDGPNDIAIFGTADQTTLDLEGVTHGFEVNSIVFDKGASIFSFDLIEGWDFLFTGAGIINNSGELQSFLAEWVPDNVAGDPDIFEFFNNATAGELTEFTIEGAPGGKIFGGELVFWDFSTAGSAVINNLGGAEHGCCNGWPVTAFEDNSSAENAAITNDGGGLYTYGQLIFEGNSTAGDATIVNNGALTRDGSGGSVEFADFSDTGDSTITCNGDSTGSENPARVIFSGGLANGRIHPGRARVILLGNGKMDVAGAIYPLQVTVGSIEGDGNIFLGGFVAVKLLVGSNNSSTTFAGIIQDNPGSSGGSFIKIGTGTLTLTGSNTYTGATSVYAGALTVANTTGSATGTGAVNVNGGTLGGKGIIAGTTTVGTGTGTNAFLAPATGTNSQATLTIQSSLTFNSDATYTCTFRAKRNRARTDQVIANGVAINSGAMIALTGQVRGSLTQGLVLTVISNTSVNPIIGTFSNLPDGGVVTINGNNFQASYTGGDGNDLTLTVVP